MHETKTIGKNLKYRTHACFAIKSVFPVLKKLYAGIKEIKAIKT